MPTGSELTALLVVVCFTAGLNVYATVVVLGLLAHAQWLTLPAGLHLLESWYVLAACLVLYLVEFIGDKIPVFDLLWNAIQTFVRVPVAALLAYGATTHLPDWEQLLAVLLGGLIALASHSGKTALRATVAHSPEPFSNSALSLGEDATAVFLLWYATRHPYIAASIVVAALLTIAVAIRVVVRAMGRLFRAAESMSAKGTGIPSA